MPVTERLWPQIADRMSRPPPTPMTATSPWRTWYGRLVTSYGTHASDSGRPSHLVTGVAASPSRVSHCSVAVKRSAPRPGPQKYTGPSPGCPSATYACVVQAVIAALSAVSHRPWFFG